MIIMPLYSYVCENCGEEFDLLVGVNSQKIKFQCKKCASKNIKKSFNSFSVGNSGFSSSGPSCPTGTCGL